MHPFNCRCRFVHCTGELRVQWQIPLSPSVVDVSLSIFQHLSCIISRLTLLVLMPLHKSLLRLWIAQLSRLPPIKFLTQSFLHLLVTSKIVHCASWTVQSGVDFRGSRFRPKCGSPIVPDAQVSLELPSGVRFCRRKACLTALHASMPD